MHVIDRIVLRRRARGRLGAAQRIARLSWGLSLIGLLAAGDVFAETGLPASRLEQVAVAPQPGAQLPLGTRWHDEAGQPVKLGRVLADKPALLIFADYTCKTLCGPILALAADALAESQLAPEDYRLVVAGIDPKDGAAEAAAVKRNQIGDSGVASATTMLTADEPTIRRLADAAGYVFQYDAAHDQFAHPAAVLVLTPDGRIARVLSGLGIDAGDIRLALVDASQGSIGSFRDQVRLLCYGFDPLTGGYSLSVYRSLSVAAAMTTITLAAALAWMSIRPRRPS
jgi:protein SCO1/2